MRSLFDRRWRPAATLLVALAMLGLDYLTGPRIGFPITFVLPVALAASAGCRALGLALAVLMPLARVSFCWSWQTADHLTVELVNAAIQVVVLGSEAYLVASIAAQRRKLQAEVRALEGMLPICAWCKRIRDEHGEWHSVESYVADHSEATFTHTYCDDCTREHYGDLLGDE